MPIYPVFIPEKSLFVANTVKNKLIVIFQLLKLHTAAKIEEEEKKGKSLTDPTVKDINESAGSTEQGEKSPSKHHHHSRKDHSLKIKLPSPEKRKRRLRRSRDEIFEVTGYILVVFFIYCIFLVITLNFFPHFFIYILF